MENVTVNKTQIPALGFGTWQLKGDNATEMVRVALDAGYRHVDTAQVYKNEAEVGRAIQQSSVGRNDIFLTTKVWTERYRKGFAESVEESLKKLRTDAVNLLLLHWPHPDLPLEAYLEPLVRLQERGLTEQIGISNFPTALMREAHSMAPQIVTNQVEYHPTLDQTPVLDLAREYGWTVTAYSPIGQGAVLKNELLRDLGEQYGKSSVHVALRWLIQQARVLAIPRSSSADHVRDNFNIWDFELSAADMERIFEQTAKENRIVNPDFAPDWD